MLVLQQMIMEAYLRCRISSIPTWSSPKLLKVEMGLAVKGTGLVTGAEHQESRQVVGSWTQRSGGGAGTG